MKRSYLFIALSILAWSTCFSQTNNCSNRTFKTIKDDFNKELNFVRSHPNINISGIKLKDFLLEAECPTRFYKEISSNTQHLISLLHESPQNLKKKTDDLYVLIQIERAVKEDDSINLYIKEKLLKAVSHQLSLLAEEEYPYYTYNTKEKKLINFISFRSGNDLLTLAGLYSTVAQSTNQHIQDGNTFFQRNDDRDYTGSVLIEIGTDYLNTMRKQPLKTYQTLLYGFDVYTPYFSDTALFPNDSSFNVLDRPHASFQYFGWSKKGISKRNKYIWSTTVKVGKIGGDIGGKFQNTVHQDISSSPRPRGWAAQIANDGRIGISLEFEQGFFQKNITGKLGLHPQSLRNLYASFFAKEMFGSYMTNASLGVKLSNKSFRQNNQNFINHRNKQTVYNRWHHLMYSVAFSTTYVQHNTMLQGYGFIKSIEEDNDELTPESKHYLREDQVKKFVHLLNITLSYTARYATFFYNWKSISPETNFNKIGINSPASGNEMSIENRWHHFAEVGVTFNLH